MKIRPPLPAPPVTGCCPECGEVFCVDRPGPIRNTASGERFARTGYTFGCRGCRAAISIEVDPDSGVWEVGWTRAILEAAEIDLGRRLAAVAA